ncbi:MAG TPA: hypothetical protein VFK65_23650, partial [Candidatus Binatia bacterium]|nr:hypothetical protein [Candidatus Binatia bacterium]
AGTWASYPLYFQGVSSLWRKLEKNAPQSTVTRERQGATIKQLYKGKVAGDEIKFTRATEGGQGNRPPIEFTAKKAK